MRRGEYETVGILADVAGEMFGEKLHEERRQRYGPVPVRYGPAELDAALDFGERLTDDETRSRQVTAGTSHRRRRRP